MKSVHQYNIELIKSKTKIQYLFVSDGKQRIIKAIEYSPILKKDGRTVYNLAFGDYDIKNNKIIDDINSNNGDIYAVFNTILSTIPAFFITNPSDIIMISGSDSNQDYTINCLKTCRKKCVTKCKNYQRRIKTYRYYVDKHFDQLLKDYIFFGRNRLNENVFVQYVPKHQYDDILIYKKN